MKPQIGQGARDAGRPSGPTLVQAKGLEGAPSATALLIDKNVTFRDELAAALGRFDIGLMWRARILGLLDTVADSEPECVILSADLPGTQPLELIRAIRQQRDWDDIPVYLVGEAIPRELELRAFTEGADAVLRRATATAEIAARLMGRAAIETRRRSGSARSLADAALALCDVAVGAQSEREGGASADTGTPARVGEAAPRPASPTVGARAATDTVGGTPSTRGDGDAAGLGPAAGLGAQYRGEPPPPPPERPAPPATPASVPDVIIVEDDPSLLEMLRYALTNRGYSTLSFSNGLDALRSLREMDTAGRRPVVLLDVDLPGLDGFRVLHELTGARPGAFQVILCTVHSSEATQVLGIQSGAMDYLIKPLRMPIVLAKVERLIAKAGISNAVGG